MSEASKILQEKYLENLSLPVLQDIQTLLEEVESLEAELRIQQGLVQQKVLHEREKCAQIAESASASNEGPVFRLCQAIAKVIRSQK